MRFRNIQHSIDVLKRKLFFFIGNLNIMHAWWWGVQTGNGLKFLGKTYFKRYPKSLISVGNNCEFLSSTNSNLIGINRPCSISTLTEDAKIEIGNNCGFSGTVIGSFISVKLGNNVRCGANTLITDSDWHFDDYRAGENKEVIIEDNVWLGVNVTVLKGVTIGRNSVIGANSVVTKNIPENTVAAGNPCKIIKKLNE